MGWLLHLNEEAEAALSLGVRGCVGDCERPKEKPFRPHEKGSLQTPTLQRHFFVMGWTFYGPVSPLCLALPSAFCHGLAPFLSLSILPLPSAPDLPGNFPMEESPKGRGERAVAVTWP